jgi:hypothetical protein
VFFKSLILFEKIAAARDSRLRGMGLKACAKNLRNRSDIKNLPDSMTVMAAARW